MTGEKRMFSSYEKNHDPQRAITFGDGNQGLVKGLGKIAISPNHFEREMFPWAISKYFGDLVSNTSA
jgi:hypothetical protein